MIYEISRNWHIPADLLVRPYRLAEDARRRRAGGGEGGFCVGDAGSVASSPIAAATAL
jgi:hypothetical protein